MSEGTLKEIERAFTDRNFLTWLGMRLIKHHPGFAQIELPVRPEFIQTAGTVHGGIIATVADCALACAILSELDPGATCSSIEIKVNYLTPVREGELRADATVIRRGKNIGVSRADIFDGDGMQVATALGTFMIQPVPGWSAAAYNDDGDGGIGPSLAPVS